ncbi:MAG: hypothetical protein ACRDD1_05860, partial [Planctomycetia bacterium]
MTRPDAATPGNDETFTWVELRNPWPKSWKNLPPTPEAARSTPIDVDFSQYSLRLIFPQKTIAQEVALSSLAVPMLPTRDDGDDGLHGGHYLVGPGPTAVGLIDTWTDANNDLTSAEMLFTAPAESGVDANKGRVVQIELQRKRVPYAGFTIANRNPDVTLDAMDLDQDAGVNGGSYHVNDMSAVGDRYSLERKQPWVAQGTRKWVDWRPMGDSVVDDLFGRCLGFPVVGSTALVDPQQGALWSNEEGTVTDRPDVVQNRPVVKVRSGTPHSLAYKDDAARGRNTQDALSYLWFPFHNRPLASPLELLSVRLYGVENHGPEVKLDPMDPNAPNFRLRFTDDFEFVKYQTAMMPNSGEPGIYRSRLAPWLEDVRGPFYEHPGKDGNRPNGVDPGAYMNQLVAMPDMHRFFEFVTCRDRFRAHESNVPVATDGDTNVGPVLASAETVNETRQRTRRLGLINLNTVTDEEVFRALVDSEEILPSRLVAAPAVDVFSVQLATHLRNMNYNPFRTLTLDSL